MTDTRSVFGVRERILATVLVLAAIGMGIAGAAFTVFERRQAIDHVDAVLRSNVRQFNEFATMSQNSGSVGSKPLTVANLLEGAMRRHFATDGEDLAGIIDDKVTFVSPGARIAIEREDELVAAVNAIAPNSPTLIRQVNTQSAGPVRFVAIQTQVQGKSEHGVYLAAVSLEPVLDRLTRSAWAYAGLSLAALVLVGIGGWLVAGRLLKPLGLIHDAASSISHTDLSARIPVSGHDDVSDLTRSVNAMLERLENAFATQQSFLDDAGHELRTPLTIVRGHLELVDANSPEDVHATCALVTDELDRMGRLVNDLIVLAQSGRPDFVRLEPVDLDRLMNEISSKVPALAERIWLLESTPAVIADVDAHRLTQALLQLTDNAVRYTTPQDVIALGGRVTPGGLVEFWVRDTGPGVPLADRQKIFQRFGRAGTARGDSGSSGLGLSIVAGIAAAHGGSVHLDETYRAGARFVLTLPLRRRGALRDGASGPTRPAAASEVISSLFQPYRPVVRSENGSSVPPAPVAGVRRTEQERS